MICTERAMNNKDARWRKRGMAAALTIITTVVIEKLFRGPHLRARSRHSAMPGGEGPIGTSAGLLGRPMSLAVPMGPSPPGHCGVAAACPEVWSPEQFTIINEV